MSIPELKTKNSGFILLKSFRDNDGGGLLSVAQSAKRGVLELPIEGGLEIFRAERLFFITDIASPDATRANHAHRKTSEAIFCVQGACTVHLDDGESQQDVILDDPVVGIITGPNLWHSITNFAPGTVLLALADGPYDPDEYIHEHRAFLEEILS